MAELDAASYPLRISLSSVLIIDEESFEALGDDLAQRGYCQVSFAAAGLADQQEAGALLIGEIAHELLDGQQDGGEFAARGGVFVARHHEVIEGSFAVEIGNIRFSGQSLRTSLGAAFAGSGAGQIGVFGNDEPQATALRANRLASHRFYYRLDSACGAGIQAGFSQGFSRQDEHCTALWCRDSSRHRRASLALAS